MLFVVGAMAALSIDAVTIYTARSEAQLAADAGALAGARVLANSGVTSVTSGLPPGAISDAENLATTVATQVAASSQVGGRTLIPGGTCPGQEICVSFDDTATTFRTDPHVTVTVQRTDLPTFFARVFGRTQLQVAASATAEAYNPSGMTALGDTPIPVAPVCVKPWILPNLDPTVAAPGAAIFNADGSIVNAALVGQGWPKAGGNLNGLRVIGAGNPPAPGRYYAGAIDATGFPAPTQALPACSSGFAAYPYMLAVAGCVSQPISCGKNATVNLAPAGYASKTGSRNGDTVEAVECLIHYNGAAGDTDSIDTSAVPYPLPPFQFLGGNQNPITGTPNKDVMVSGSLVTIPVYDSTTGTGPGVGNPVNVIGFLQVFLNPLSATMPPPPPPAPPATQIPVTIVNMVGCGTGATGQPILGNGTSPVAVRLISPP